MEATQALVKSAVDGLVDELDKRFLRDIQQRMFDCSARCCENQDVDRRRLDSCIARCGRHLHAAQEAVDHELGALQQSLSLCTESCRDQVLRKFDWPTRKQPTDAQLASFKQEICSCINNCARNQLELIPTIREHLIDRIRNA